MLVLSRKAGEVIVIDLAGQEVAVHILRTATGRVSLGVVAPREVKVRRGELAPNSAKIAEEIG